jgi:hypothetical protein
MCCGALMNASISTLVMGGRPSPDQARFGDYTMERLLEMSKWGDRMEVVTDVLVDECMGIRQP